MEVKKVFAIAFLALMLGFIAYSNAEIALSYAGNFTNSSISNSTFNNINIYNSNITNSTFNTNGLINLSGNTTNDLVEGSTNLYFTNTRAVTALQGINNAQNNSIINLQTNNTYFNGTVFPNSTNFRNDSLAQRIFNIELNLSNITMITANGSIVASNLPDGLGNITNVTASGGLIATWI